jgi:hypothetical protein
MITRTGGYAYDVGVWDLSIIQGIHFLSRRSKPDTIRNFCIALRASSADRSRTYMRPQPRWCGGRHPAHTVT